MVELVSICGGSVSTETVDTFSFLVDDLKVVILLINDGQSGTNGAMVSEHCFSWKPNFYLGFHLPIISFLADASLSCI